MNRISIGLGLGAALLLAAWGCGENLADPAGTLSPNRPQELKALSVNEAAVRLQWVAPQGAADSSFAGYSVAYLAKEEFIPKGALTHTVVSLPPSDVAFTVYSVTTAGRRSDGAPIHWAPAARFDSAIVLTEFSASDLTVMCGLDVGSSSLNPRAMALADINAAALMDLYLWGDEGREPLVLRAAGSYLGAWKPTRFSAVESPSLSLDLPLSEYPSDYVNPAAAVGDNRIYYLRVIDEIAQVHYARVHVHALPGTGTRRSVAVRISLQRTPALQFAGGPGEMSRRSFGMIPLSSFLR